MKKKSEFDVEIDGKSVKFEQFHVEPKIKKMKYKWPQRPTTIDMSIEVDIVKLENLLKPK